MVSDVLKRLTNAAWSLDNLPVATLSRYMRSLFRLSVSLPSNTTTAVSLHLLSQISNLAQHSEATETRYPDDELEYLATTAFNKAVDFYCIEDDDSCKKWAEKAIEIAGFLQDRGSLAGMLRERFVGLRFDRNE